MYKKCVLVVVSDQSVVEEIRNSLAGSYYLIFNDNVEKVGRFANYLKISLVLFQASDGLKGIGEFKTLRKQTGDIPLLLISNSEGSSKIIDIISGCGKEDNPRCLFSGEDLRQAVETSLGKGPSGAQFYLLSNGMLYLIDEMVRELESRETGLSRAKRIFDMMLKDLALLKS